MSVKMDPPALVSDRGSVTAPNESASSLNSPASNLLGGAAMPGTLDALAVVLVADALDAPAVYCRAVNVHHHGE